MKNIIMKTPPLPICLSVDYRAIDLSYVPVDFNLYPYFSLIHVVEGVLYIKNDLEYTLEENQFVIFPPLGMPTKLFKKTICSFWCYDFYFDGEWEIVGKNQISHFMKQDVESTSLVKPSKTIVFPLHGTLDNPLFKKPKESDFLNRQIVLLKILREIEKLQIGESLGSYELIAIHTQNIINENFTSINMQTISKQLNYNSDYIERCFKKYYKKNIRSYILELKMQYALELLKTKTVSEISDILNYNNVSSFSRQFKLYYKSNPTEFLKKLENKTE